MGFEDEAEQSIGRPYRQTNGRSKRPNELTSSIVPRGTSFHRSVELEFPPIAFDPVRPSCRYDLPGPAELGAVNPDAVHDHGQPTRQRHDRLFHPAAPGDLHRPGLEPRPLAGARETVKSSVTITAGGKFLQVLASSATERQALTIENSNTTDSCWILIG